MGREKPQKPHLRPKKRLTLPDWHKMTSFSTSRWHLTSHLGFTNVGDLASGPTAWDFSRGFNNDGNPSGFPMFFLWLCQCLLDTQGEVYDDLISWWMFCHEDNNSHDVSYIIMIDDQYIYICISIYLVRKKTHLLLVISMNMFHNVPYISQHRLHQA
jgi:hypothetical protein